MIRILLYLSILSGLYSCLQKDAIKKISCNDSMSAQPSDCNTSQEPVGDSETPEELLICTSNQQLERKIDCKNKINNSESAYYTEVCNERGTNIIQSDCKLEKCSSGYVISGNTCVKGTAPDNSCTLPFGDIGESRLEACPDKEVGAGRSMMCDNSGNWIETSRDCRFIGTSCSEPESSDIVAIGQLDNKFQKIDGFGSSIRLFDDPHVTETFNPVTKRAAVVIPEVEKDKILKALYQDIGFTIIRPATENEIELTNDNLDPLSFNESSFDFSWKNGDGYIDYVQRALPFSPLKYFLSPIELESWMTEDTPEEYAEWAMAALIRWKNNGIEPPFYSILNEPSYRRGGVWSAQFIKEAVKALGRRLDSAGLTTKLIIPDDVRSTNAADISRVVLADPEARKYIGVLATHLYDESITNIKKMTDLGKQYGIPVWMTEFSITGMRSAGISNANYLKWASLMHDLLSDYNVSAILYMWGFFGEWESTGSQLIRIRYSGASYAGFDKNRSYYAMGQFSKLVRPGFVRVGVTTPQGTDDLKISAYTLDSKVVFVAVNEGPSRRIHFQLNEKNSIQSVTQEIITSDSKQMESLSSACKSNDSIVYDLPANSIFSLEINYTRLPNQ